MRFMRKASVTHCWLPTVWPIPEPILTQITCAEGSTPHFLCQTNSGVGFGTIREIWQNAPEFCCAYVNIILFLRTLINGSL
jgi:hypothetical protein